MDRDVSAIIEAVRCNTPDSVAAMLQALKGHEATNLFFDDAVLFELAVRAKSGGGALLELLWSHWREFFSDSLSEEKREELLKAVEEIEFNFEISESGDVMLKSMMETIRSDLERQ